MSTGLRIDIPRAALATPPSEGVEVAEAPAGPDGAAVRVLLDGALEDHERQTMLAKLIWLLAEETLCARPTSSRSRRSDP